jgi:hypothetical protein
MFTKSLAKAMIWQFHEKIQYDELRGKVIAHIGAFSFLHQDDFLIREFPVYDSLELLS